MQYVTCDVATYCIGQAASMGAVLLAAGTKGKRNALPHARVMIHQPLAGTEGTTTEILIRAKEFLRLKKDLNEILLKHTGQTLERIEKDTDRDKFMSARGGAGIRHRGPRPGAPARGPGAAPSRSPKWLLPVRLGRAKIARIEQLRRVHLRLPLLAGRLHRRLGFDLARRTDPHAQAGGTGFWVWDF